MCSQNAETENRKNTVEKSWLNIKHKKTECRNRKQKEYGGKKVTLHSAQCTFSKARSNQKQQQCLINQAAGVQNVCLKYTHREVQWGALQKILPKHRSAGWKKVAQHNAQCTLSKARPKQKEQ